MNEIELTILMPCLNESQSLAFCIQEAKQYIQESGVSAEILIADNGSTDASRKIASDCGARVELIAEKGYGNALMGGIQAAQGKYIIMGDCDGSYDFSQADDFLQKLRAGFSLVVGNRYLGGIEKHAMPFLHRRIGVPFLSMLGRWRYKVSIGDFHCGLRAFHRQKALSLNLQCGGMEFATEIIGRFANAGEPICEIPTVLRCDRRGGHSHLRTIPDGWRHLRLLLSRNGIRRHG